MYSGMKALRQCLENGITVYISFDYKARFHTSIYDKRDDFYSILPIVLS